MMIHTLNVFLTHSKELLMKVSEVSAAIADVSAQLTKVRGEILDKITALEDALIDVELPEEAIAAINALRGDAQALDDIVPDIVPEPEPDVAG